MDKAKTRHVQAKEDERQARDEMAGLEKLIKECRRILNGSSAEYFMWQVGARSVHVDSAISRELSRSLPHIWLTTVIFDRIKLDGHDYNF